MYIYVYICTYIHIYVYTIYIYTGRCTFLENKLGYPQSVFNKNYTLKSLLVLGVLINKKYFGADSEKGLRHLALVGNVVLKRSAAARRDR